MRLINAIAYRRVLEEEKDYQLEHCKDSFKCRCGLEIAIADLGDMPTIDAVPVVRCKDCKHRGDHEVCPLHDIRLCFDGDGHMDEVEDDKTEDEFFCSYGERKEAEGDG